jgi:hypothetical protein
VFKWFRRHQDSARLEEDDVDVEALIRRYGNGAYHESRRRKRDVVMSEQVLKDDAEKLARLDTAIRMLKF